MFENQTEELIRNRMITKAPEGINTGEGDFFYDAVSPAAIELALAYLQLDRVLEVGFAETSHGDYLDKIVSERGLARKSATKGSGLIQVTMAVGSVITEGDVLATYEGDIRFVAAETRVVGETGRELVRFENERAGNLGNVLAGTAFVAPVAIPGFISAVNPSLINAGTDGESDASLRNRYFEAVKTPATSGNRYHYLQWAKEKDGVGDARIFTPDDGSRTVEVVIIDSNMQPAAQTLVDEAQEYIDPGSTGLGEGQAPIGAICRVSAAETLNIDVSAAITGAEDSVVKPLFESALDGYLKSIAFTASAVSYVQVAALLMDSVSRAGGTDCTGVLVNNGTSNVQVGDRQVAVRGTVTLE